ncbi:hybrid sensor histidine kinase/response regulator [Pseudoalteromonas lipolytica]|uniref:histidine kinase n=1 Tax=Pseudoalteromonas lipolytica TaxID=570156 RepID=A0ABU8T064_9GAMM
MLNLFLVTITSRQIKKWIFVVYFSFLLLCSFQLMSKQLSLTEEEKAWIKKNPIVRVHVPVDFRPFHYIEDGHITGLASEYMSFITQKTGLHFEAVEASRNRQERINQFLEKQVDMTAAVVKSQLSETLQRKALFTAPYYATNTLVITRKNGPTVFDLRLLRGSTVAVRREVGYGRYIEANYPEIRLLKVESLYDTLSAVAEGRAEFAIGTGPILLSNMRNSFDDILDVSGMLSSLPVEISMAVQPEQPILYRIISKALASLPVSQVDEIVQRQVDSWSYIKPSFYILLRYYGFHIVLLVIILTLITFLALHARKQQGRAIRSEQEKTMFLAVLSHEIRSPLNAVIATLELLLLKSNSLSIESKRLLTLATNGVENLLYLLNNVLDVSKLESGRMQLDLQPVDITEATRSVIDMLKLNANKGVKLVFQVASPITFYLVLDRYRVIQILHNLISNSLKFTPQGQILVNLYLDIGRFSQNHHELVIRIDDTGVGMDTSSLQHLFRPYAQASASTASNFGGSGLGLHICWQLVTMMEGSITIDSEVGKGTTVTVRLPCEGDVKSEITDNQKGSKMPSKLNVETESPPNVLIVEDTIANQLALKAQLITLGCKPTLVNDGEQALLALKKDPYDIVLMDCDLPGISGYEVVRQWREFEVASGDSTTPIIAISALSDGIHTSTCFEVGMDGVLCKPINLGKLNDTLGLWTKVPESIGEEQEIPILNQLAIIMEIRADVHALRIAIEEHDDELVIHQTHRLSGAFSVLQAPSLAALSKAIGIGVKRGLYASARKNLGSLEQLLVQFESELEKDSL